MCGDRRPWTSNTKFRNYSRLQMTHLRAKKYIHNRTIYEMWRLCRGGHVPSQNRFLLFYISHCFAVEAVTWQNTQLFSSEKVYEITSPTAWENRTNCKICIKIFLCMYFFLLRQPWNVFVAVLRVTCSWLINSV